MECSNQNRNLPSEVIPISDEDSKDINKNIQHKKRRRNKQTRRVTLDTSKEKETLIVKQKVKVKKQKFQCIINLTNICESTKKDKKKKHVCKRRRKSEDRIVPQCLRLRCQSLISSKCCKRKESVDVEILKELKSLDPVKKEKSFKNSLSLISSEDFDCNNNISYEEISSGSFSSDNDLDTLIKRAKRREKKSSQETPVEPLIYTSTPKHYSTVPDCDITPGKSSETLSIHTVATLVLDTDLNYSPIRQFDVKDCEYHPESPTDNLIIDTKSIDLSNDGSTNLVTNPENDSKLFEQIGELHNSGINVDKCYDSNKIITSLISKDLKKERISPELFQTDVEFCNNIPKIENVISLNKEFLQEPLVRTENEMFEGSKRMKLGSGFIFEGADSLLDLNK